VAITLADIGFSPHRLAPKITAADARRASGCSILADGCLPGSVQEGQALG
jgi:hypothetical protein